MFSKGDRVEVTSAPFTGLIRVVTKRTDDERYETVEAGREATMRFWPHEIKLITEEPMYTHEQKLQALKDSVAVWERKVEIFSNAPVGGELASVKDGCEHCPLCQMVGNGKAALPSNCRDCPLDGCEEGSLYGVYSDTDTNPEAYTASKAMLARLEELLVEEQGKAKKDIRVGDIVVLDSESMPSFDNAAHVAKYTSEVVSLCDERGTLIRKLNGQERWDGSKYKMIWRTRPTKGK